MVKLDWTKGFSKGVSYYVAGVNKGEFNTFVSDFIAYKIVLDVNVLSMLVKLRVLSKGYWRLIIAKDCNKSGSI